MHITTEHVYIMQDEGPSLFYESRESYTGKHALGSTHIQAISNVLGLLYAEGLPVFKKN
jgi:hypothetical protein